MKIFCAFFSFDFFGEYDDVGKKTKEMIKYIKKMNKNILFYLNSKIFLYINNYYYFYIIYLIIFLFSIII